MSEFKGETRRVRCVDCKSFLKDRCLLKDVSVSSKKRRLCPSYTFKGEFVNRSPEDVPYIQHVDKSTKRFIRKLLKSNSNDLQKILNFSNFSQKNPGLFRSTATSNLLSEGEVERLGESAPQPENSQL